MRFKRIRLRALETPKPATSNKQPLNNRTLDTKTVKEVLNNDGFLRLHIALTPAQVHLPLINADLSSDRFADDPVITQSSLILRIKSKPLFIPHAKSQEIINTGYDSWVINAYYDVAMGLHLKDEMRTLAVDDFEGVLLQDIRVYLEANADFALPSLALTLNFNLKDRAEIEV